MTASRRRPRGATGSAKTRPLTPERVEAYVEAYRQLFLGVYGKGFNDGWAQGFAAARAMDESTGDHE